MKNGTFIVKVNRSTHSVSVDIAGTEVWFESDSEVVCTDNFALWLSLPFAMQKGSDLHINGSVSPKAIQQAQKLISIWSTWAPDQFSEISVTADKVVKTTTTLREKSLMLFSGGVDSTFALREECKTNTNQIDTLTILGMDYHSNGKKNFGRLLEKTNRFVSLHSKKQIVVRSNAAFAMRDFGIDGSYGHGFQLLATLFLFDEIYDEGMIAADYNAAQEYLVAPWGTCSFTNNLFLTESFHIRTLSTEFTRSEKVMALSDDEISLNSISFCKDHSIRPQNCGVCSKCVRTKSMFYAATGKIPPIFLQAKFDERDLGALDLSLRSELMFAKDILKIAREKGNQDGFRQLQLDVLSGFKEPRYRSLMRSLRGQIASRIRSF